MDGAVEAGEAMVGNDHQGGARARGAHGLTDGRIHAFVDFEQFVVMPGPEHVRILVHAGKIIEQQAARKPAQLVAEHAQAIVQNFPALRKELGARQDAGAEGGGLFGDPLGVKRPEFLGERPAEAGGR